MDGNPTRSDARNRETRIKSMKSARWIQEQILLPQSIEPTRGSSNPCGLLSGESEKSKRFHLRNVRSFYPQILRKSPKSEW
jgi:hypothetical protein